MERSKTSTLTMPNVMKSSSKPAVQDSPGKDASTVATLCSCFVWVAIVILPLTLTYNELYKTVFPESWYSFDPTATDRPKPLGLSLGILTVVVGQAWMITYHYFNRNGHIGSVKPIQRETKTYDFFEGVATHFYQPAGFILLGAYLAGTWLFRLLPDTYYSFDGGIDWVRVLGCLLFQDCFQMGIHYSEHVVTSWYRISHKAHHKWTNPRLFDAYNADVKDAVVMITIPLFVTAHVIPMNVWSYMAFGSLYSNWLTLIHSEFSHPWDSFFRKIGFGTAADHHVHHKLFKYNFGHLFMYWDIAFGTYRNPAKCLSVFNEAAVQ
eukprot:m.90265 g.90265  ORF g.90265 m.90265 type:complete len:322 (-) comp26379_c1_seq1:232-1197(-)